MKLWKKVFLIVSSLGGLAFLFLIYYYFLAEHVVYSKDDPHSGLVFTAVCVSSEGSYRTYVKVSLKRGRTISVTEIPGSADMLSDCYRERYRVVDIRPDPEYRKLTVFFLSDRRSPVDVPIRLEGIDGW